MVVVSSERLEKRRDDEVVSSEMLAIQLLVEIPAIQLAVQFFSSGRLVIQPALELVSSEIRAIHQVADIDWS